MPTSRRRTPRNRSAKQRRRALRLRQREQRSTGQRHLVATLRPGESLEHLLTDDDRRCMQLATDAEARGDAWAAWHHHVSGLLVEESLTHHRLLELARLEDDAPAWMCSRWAVDQALRWMLLTDDPRCDQIVRTVMAGLHFDQVEPLLDDPVGLVEYGTRVAACDWVYQQLAAYEAGGLRDFLDARAEPGLLDRLDHIDEWERAAVTAYELVDVQGDVLRARRLDDDEPVELLNLGATTDIGPGATVVGRVVPVSVWPFAMFESRPLPVDEVTARDVAERRRDDDDDLGWFRALAAAHDSGRLPAGSTCGHGTLWSTDIVPMAQWATNEENQHLVEGAGEEAGRVTELKAAGLSDRVANDVCVAELGLVVARVTGDAGPVAPHVTAVMMDPRVFEALKQHSTLDGSGPFWRILAAATPSPVRDRCVRLAELSDERAA